MTHDERLRDAAWRTSSYSTSGNQCVEVAPLPGGDVAIRDSKNRDAGTHILSRRTWDAFITAIKAAEV
ncbi:MAG TPA: DUF397 domain-containing protein [Streptosporangiaceae bacterium]|nr:DUF397 domain-containing protein [Streptosporangiaceae bacterium]